MNLEIHELFGAFPKKDDIAAKFIMTSMELSRVHAKLNDFRNAYKIVTQCAKMFPKNPFVLSKAGRFCLEIGRLSEA